MIYEMRLLHGDGKGEKEQGLGVVLDPVLNPCACQF